MDGRSELNCTRAEQSNRIIIRCPLRSLGVFVSHPMVSQCLHTKWARSRARLSSFLFGPIFLFDDDDDVDDDDGQKEETVCLLSLFAHKRKWWNKYSTQGGESRAEPSRREIMELSSQGLGQWPPPPSPSELYWITQYWWNNAQSAFGPKTRDEEKSQSPGAAKHPGRSSSLSLSTLIKPIIMIRREQSSLIIENTLSVCVWNNCIQLWGFLLFKRLQRFPARKLWIFSMGKFSVFSILEVVFFLWTLGNRCVRLWIHPPLIELMSMILGTKIGWILFLLLLHGFCLDILHPHPMPLTGN